MADTLLRQALLRDLARRLELASHDEVRVVELALRRLELLRASPVTPVTRDLFDRVLLETHDDLYAERRDREQRHEADRDELIGGEG